MSGENYEYAAVRGLQEELWIVVDIDLLVSLGKWTPETGFGCFATYFLVERKDDIHPNILEWVAKAERVSLEKYGNIVENESKRCKMDLINCYNYFFESLTACLTKPSSD